MKLYMFNLVNLQPSFCELGSKTNLSFWHKHFIFDSETKIGHSDSEFLRIFNIFWISSSSVINNDVQISRRHKFYKNSLNKVVNFQIITSGWMSVIIIPDNGSPLLWNFIKIINKKFHNKVWNIIIILEHPLIKNTNTAAIWYNMIIILILISTLKGELRSCHIKNVVNKAEIH